MRSADLRIRRRGRRGPAGDSKRPARNAAASSPASATAGRRPAPRVAPQATASGRIRRSSIRRQTRAPYSGAASGTGARSTASSALWSEAYRPRHSAHSPRCRPASARALFAVVVQDQFFFAEVVHFTVLSAGSRARRNFCTARNTLCLAAPGWHSRTRRDFLDPHALEMAQHECGPFGGAQSRSWPRPDARRISPLRARRSASGSGRTAASAIGSALRPRPAAHTFRAPSRASGPGRASNSSRCDRARCRSWPARRISELPVGAQEALLHHVLGVRFVSRHAIRQAEQRTAMALHQHAERVGIACARLADRPRRSAPSGCSLDYGFPGRLARISHRCSGG